MLWACTELQQHPQKSPPEPLKTEGPPKKPAIDLTRDPAVWHEETGGFTVDREITLEGVPYRHLVTFLYSHKHFSTIVTYNNETWAGGIDKKPQLHYVGPTPFVSMGRFRGKETQPTLHVYICKRTPSANEDEGNLMSVD